MKRASSSASANGQRILFCEDQFADTLPMGTQLAFLVHARHVVARIAEKSGGRIATAHKRQRGRPVTREPGSSKLRRQDSEEKPERHHITVTLSATVRLDRRRHDYFSSSLRGGSRSTRSACSASAVQSASNCSNRPFMDSSFACAARFLASEALCRYSSDRDDM